MWATPQARLGEGRSPQAKRWGDPNRHGGWNLDDQVAANWPTPTSLSFGESHQPGNSKSMNDTLRLASFLPAPETLTDGAPSSPPRRILNPLFVEWLMGWPPGWTDFACSATALSHWRQRMLGALSALASPSAAPPAQLALFG